MSRTISKLRLGKHAAAHEGQEVRIASNKLVKGVHGGAVADEFGAPNAVFVVGPGKIRELRAQFLENLLVDRVFERQRRGDVGNIELRPPRVRNGLEDFGTDDLRPMALVPIGGGEQHSGETASLENLMRMLEHRDSGPIDRRGRNRYLFRL